jgi:hypothetical protein
LRALAINEQALIKKSANRKTLSAARRAKRHQALPFSYARRVDVIVTAAE